MTKPLRGCTDMAANPARGDKVQSTIPREPKPPSLPNTLTSSQDEVVF